MPELPKAKNTAGGAIGAAQGSKSNRLRVALVEAVLAVPGVVRLEPALSTVGPGGLLHRRPTDGIRLLHRAGVVDVDLNIATAATHQARATTHQIHEKVADLLTAQNYTPGSVTVSVLTITPLNRAEQKLG